MSQVLLLDHETYLFRDPTRLFSAPAYARAGALARPSPTGSRTPPSSFEPMLNELARNLLC